MAFGYPVKSMGYTNATGTDVGLYDCLGCTAYNAGFTKEDIIGTSDQELTSLPLSEGWLTPSDLFCVLDDIYTYDVIEAEKAAAPTATRVEATPAGDVFPSDVSRDGRLYSQFFEGTVLGIVATISLCLILRSLRRAQKWRHLQKVDSQGTDLRMMETSVAGYDVRANDAALRATVPCSTVSSRM